MKPVQISQVTEQFWDWLRPSWLFINSPASSSLFYFNFRYSIRINDMRKSATDAVPFVCAGPATHGIQYR